jgi:hypothetical protein
MTAGPTTDLTSSRKCDGDFYCRRLRSEAVLACVAAVGGASVPCFNLRAEAARRRRCRSDLPLIRLCELGGRDEG